MLHYSELKALLLHIVVVLCAALEDLSDHWLMLLY